MKKFFEVVKVNLSDDIAKYFRDVEVESIKTTKNKDALHFYIVSKDIIPYDALKKAETSITTDLFKLVDDDLAKSFAMKPISLYIRYELEGAWSCKKIYDVIRKDLLKEIKNTSLTYSAFINEDYLNWTDANTLEIGFDRIESLKEKQEELVQFIKNIFKNRFDKDLNTKIVWLEYNYNSEKKTYKSKKIEEEKEQSVDRKIEKLNKNTNIVENKTDNNSKNKTLGRGKYKRLINAEGDILYGAKGKTRRKHIAIIDALYAMDNIEISGIIYNIKKFIPKEKPFTIYSIFITDNESAIEVKFFGETFESALFDKRFKIGLEVNIEGKVVDDAYARAYVITPTCITEISQHIVIEYGKPGDDDYYNEIVTDRNDNEPIKRVELHLHTKLSAKDGIGDIKQYIATAKRFGMNAMAVTDHGVVNALADANLYLKKELKDNDFKIINGVEGYLVDDNLVYYFDKNEKEVNDNFSFDNEFVVFEIVTTGQNKKNDAVIEIIANKISEKKEVGHFDEYVYTDKPITFEVKEKTGIKTSDIENAKKMEEVLKDFKLFIGDAIVVVKDKTSNWKLNELFLENSIEDNFKYLDLTAISRLMLGGKETTEMPNIAKGFSVKIEGITNRKLKEQKKDLSAKETLTLSTEVFKAILVKLKLDFSIDDIDGYRNKFFVNDEYLKKLKSYHIILLAKNDVGRVNLYKLVSDSHVKYFYGTPRMPRTLINQYREGLIIGSACIAGELMQAVKNNLSDNKLLEIASFYDYLEIQPTLNNSFLLKEDPNNFKTIEDLENLNKKIVEIGEKLDKKVVATCDCHYVEKSDKIYREILRTGIRNKKANQDKDGNVKDDISLGLESTNDEHLYFRTTSEMLEEFSYLGVDKAYEVVVKNTNIISNMIEKVLPVRLDKCPPYIEGSDEELTNSCFTNLKRIYGDNVPSVVEERLNNELKYIIDNGYSVMYITAKKLIDYSKENGFSVGSRGSVGSSLAATLSGVSEVNPLKPHYVCPNCHYIEYDTEFTRKYDNDSGFDMPDKECPKCKTMMNKDGVNIPFETFLGIPGDPKAAKEPDIDLNFCSVFQSKIHEKTIDLFGKENTFKAGTVGTVAAKTAYGYVRKFAEVVGLNLTNSQVDFYKGKIIDCKNTTSQHPGGMIVVPEGEKIYTFTPIQIAANKEGNDITTQFDYHKIDENLLKLDILGHDAPLMLKKLSEVTGVDFNTVPFYEKDVLKLFESTESLGIKPSDISGTRLGCLTIPEFGTDFAMNMCLEAKPKTVADLIRIAGLAHGTNVWQGNVQDLIKNGDCTLSTAICCRDDIMVYLIDKGLDSGMAFNIMEMVRKGKGKKMPDEYREEMRSHGVPEWYIGCCDKIQYMFPKAHAAAYVLASLRIAYYKVHYPKEYYATYFSIENNKDGFDYKLMMKDKEEIHFHIEKIAKIINEKKNSDKRFKAEFEKAESPMDALERYQKGLKNGYGHIADEDKEEVEISNNEDLNDTVSKIKEQSDVVQNYNTMSASKLFDLYMCYRHVEEMKARGIDFCPIDIYKAKRSDFIIVDGEIMPSFDSIPGIGTKDYEIDFDENKPIKEKSTAMKCEIEGAKGEYTSIENFFKRTGVNNTIIEEMKSLGLFNGLREKEETTIFDFM